MNKLLIEGQSHGQLIRLTYSQSRGGRKLRKRHSKHARGANRNNSEKNNTNSGSQFN